MINELYTVSTQVCVYDNFSKSFKYMPTKCLVVGDIFKLPVSDGFATNKDGEIIILKALDAPKYNNGGFFTIKVTDYKYE